MVEPKVSGKDAQIWRVILKMNRLSLVLQRPNLYSDIMMVSERICAVKRDRNQQSACNKPCGVEGLK